jgi:hypothetical protein
MVNVCGEGRACQVVIETVDENHWRQSYVRGRVENLSQIVYVSNDVARQKQKNYDKHSFCATDMLFLGPHIDLFSYCH